MGSRRTTVALRRRAAIALAVWAVALTMLAVAAALPGGPTARLTVDNAYPAVGEVVHFNASASEGHDAGNGRIVAYRFAFGDGQMTAWQTSPLADHAYAAAGTYVANVTAVDHRGETGTASATIHAGATPPPPTLTPDLVPIQARLSPATPRVNESVNVTVVVLNRGGTAANAATLVAYDVPQNASSAIVGTETLSGPVAASHSASAAIGPFVFHSTGNHTLRLVVMNVTPPETGTSNNELDLRIAVLPATAPTPPGGGGGGPGLTVSPLAIGLAASAVAAGAGAAYFFLRPRAPRSLEPPPPAPPDRSPPPIWPP